MMSKTASLSIIIPNLIIMYLLFYNMQYFVGKRQFFGVSIKQDYTNMDEFQVLSKEFKRLITIGFVLITVMSMICIFIFDKNEFIATFSIIAFVLYNFFVYINIHNKTKELKSKLLKSSDISDVEPSTKTIIDVKFINERDKILKKFRLIYLLPVFIVAIACIYALSKYSQIPSEFPNHWSITGEADSFLEKSYSNLFINIGSHLVLIILIAIIGISSIKSRVKINPNDVEKSRSENIRYLHKTGYTFLFVLLSLVLMTTNIIISIVKGPNLNPIIMMLSTLILIVSSIYLIFTYRKSPNSLPNSSYTPDDDECYWIWGSIYNNPNDPSFMVQKRFGIGWTINLGHPGGKILFIITILILSYLIFDLIKLF